MGRLSKRHNWKARLQVETKVDRSAEKQVGDNISIRYYQV